LLPAAPNFHSNSHSFHTDRAQSHPSLSHSNSSVKKESEVAHAVNIKTAIVQYLQAQIRIHPFNKTKALQPAISNYIKARDKKFKDARPYLQQPSPFGKNQ
jgi:hypothetical protein